MPKRNMGCRYPEEEISEDEGDSNDCPCCGSHNSIKEHLEYIRAWERVEFTIGVGLNTRTIKRAPLTSYKMPCSNCNEMLQPCYLIIEGIAGWTTEKLYRLWERFNGST